MRVFAVRIESIMQTRILLVTVSVKNIVDALQDLCAQTPQRRITYEEIADKAGCSSMTIRRSMPKLIHTGVVKRSPTGRGFGYFYEVKEPNAER